MTSMYHMFMAVVFLAILNTITIFLRRVFGRFTRYYSNWINWTIYKVENCVSTFAVTFMSLSRLHPNISINILTSKG